MKESLEIQNNTKKIFYDMYDMNPEKIKSFGIDLATMINGCMLTSIYRVRDGIHFGYTCSGNAEPFPVKELSDIAKTAITDFIISNTDKNDNKYKQYVNSDQRIAKIFTIDNEHFTIVI